jgi:hypothetical protein
MDMEKNGVHGGNVKIIVEEFYLPLKVKQYFGGICSLHLQGRRISQARNQYEGGSKQRWR